MNHLIILASDANSPTNQWLNKNPLVLGLLFLAIGAVLAGYGVYELRKGVARDQYGNEMKGAMGKFVAVVRLVGGAAACVFGIYKMIPG